MCLSSWVRDPPELGVRWRRLLLLEQMSKISITDSVARITESRIRKRVLNLV